MNTAPFIPTTEQIKATERHLDCHGNPYYTAKSATDDSIYTVRWRDGHYWPRCNCRDGGLKCWHAATAQYKESVYQEALQDGELQARMREELAVKQYGSDQAYQPTPFDLMAS